jgi:SAM-dependent methyltransferase
VNLLDLVKRKDRAVLEVGAGVEPIVHRAGSTSMHSLRIPAGERLRIGELLSFGVMKAPPRLPGWSLAAVTPGALRLTLDVEFGGRRFAVWSGAVDARAGDWTPVRCDWPVQLAAGGDAVLHVTAGGPAGSAVALGISEVVDLRGPVLALAKGDGIEIGPGTNPLVSPASDVRVRYLERYPVEEWSRLYPKTRLEDIPQRVRDLWCHYVVGDAQRLECVADASIDFVFSSHVFEHLVNPLGTLAVWRAKLRPGGRVLGVTPDANHCFDLRQPLSTAADWERERQRGTFDCEDHHYEKWVRWTEPRVTVESLKQRGYSVHVHYYTARSFADLLDLAVRDHGYRGHHIRSTPNHKDFAWVLQA